MPRHRAAQVEWAVASTLLPAILSRGDVKKMHCLLCSSLHAYVGLQAPFLRRRRSGEKSAYNRTTARQNQLNFVANVRVNTCKAKQSNDHLKHVAKSVERLSCCQLQKAGDERSGQWA